MKKSQHQLIMNHLKNTKGITVREAMIEYHVSSLSKRIQELRERGFDILSVKKKHPVTGQRYVRYVLQGEEA